MGLIDSVLSPVKSVVGGINDAFGSGKTTQSQVPLETPEQRAARQMLMRFAQSGTLDFGGGRGYTAGEDIGIGYGNFDTSGYERQGLSNLGNLLSSGIPDQFKLGDDALRDLLATGPGGVEAQFNPFKDIVNRQIRESDTDLKRQAGFAGNLYSTNTVRGLGDIRARGNETLTAQLANLTNEALNRRLQAVPLAYQSGAAQEGIRMGRIGASQQFGGLERNLNNARIQDRNAELLRRRDEMTSPIDAARSVIGAPVNFGVPSVSIPNANPFLDLLGMAAEAFGKSKGRG